MRADGIDASMSTVQRAMRRGGLLQPVDYQGERREHARARKAAFAQPPDGPNQVWQLDFSEYETTTGGTWALAGCCDYFSKYEFGWHIAGTCTGADAIAAVRLAIVQAETLAGGMPLIEQLRVHPLTGKPKRISWSPTTVARSKGTRSRRSSPHAPNLSRLERGVRALARTGSGTRFRIAEIRASVPAGVRDPA